MMGGIHRKPPPPLKAHTPSICSLGMSLHDYSYLGYHPILKEYWSSRLLLSWIPIPQRVWVLETTPILDSQSSRSISPRCFSNPPFSLSIPSIGLWLLVLTIVHDTWIIQFPLSLPINQGGDHYSLLSKEMYHKPQLVSFISYLFCHGDLVVAAELLSCFTSYQSPTFLYLCHPSCSFNMLWSISLVI